MRVPNFSLMRDEMFARYLAECTKPSCMLEDAIAETERRIATLEQQLHGYHDMVRSGQEISPETAQACMQRQRELSILVPRCEALCHRSKLLRLNTLTDTANV